jgi:hypothetical protein
VDGQVEDSIWADLTEHLRQAVWITEAGLVKGDVATNLGNPPRVVLSAHEQMDRVALGEKAATEIGTDEPGSSRD